MPERVTKEERMLSLAIEKARDAKEILHQSLYDNNRLPDEKDDRVEQVKIKRPKAENDKTKIENSDGTHSGYGKGGEETHFKKSNIKKSRAFTISVDKKLNELKAYIRDNPEGMPPAMNPSDVKAVMKAIEDIENIMGKFN